MNTVKKIDGIIIPAATPFDEDGTLRIDWLKENYRIWNQSGVAGIMALGSNGEFRALNDDESFEVIKAASETISPDKVFIAGAGRESLYQTIAFLKRLAGAKLKIDYVSILTPCYFRGLMTDEALINYYTAVADASAYPVLIYCAPSFANDVKVSPAAMKVLADHPNIAGVKDTTPDQMPGYMDAVGGRDDFMVIAGKLSNIMYCLEHGGPGGIISSSNYFPNACARLIDILHKDGMDAAKEYYKKLSDLGSHTGGRASVAGMKAVMNLTGKKGGYPRKPVLPVKPEVLEEIKAYIADHRDMVEADFVK